MDVDTLLELIPLLNRDRISIVESYIDKFKSKLIYKHILDECIKDILLLDSKIIYLTENNILKIININGEILSSILLPCNNSFVVLCRFIIGKDNIKYIDNCKESNVTVSNNFILTDTNLINIGRNKLIIKCHNNNMDREIIQKKYISIH